MCRWQVSISVIVFLFASACSELQTKICGSNYTSLNQTIHDSYTLSDRSLLYFIDAHSQVDQLSNPSLNYELQDIPKTMAKHRVCGTILSARGTRDWHDILGLAKYNEGIFPSVRTKSRAYISNTYTDEIFEIVKSEISKQLDEKDPQGKLKFRALSETLIFHSAKFNQRGNIIASKVSVPFSDNRVIYIKKRASEKDWPFVVHIEFRGLRLDQPTHGFGTHLGKFEQVLDENPDINFVLNHLGQLSLYEVSELILGHDNIYFLTAHVTPTIDYRVPWTIIFNQQGQDCAFKDNWKNLVEQHPDRFIFALDNVFQKHWAKDYKPQMNCWVSALRTIQPDTAHAIAHGNAENMWKLPH